MNCPNCGAVLNESSNLCHICGTKINSEAGAPVQQTAPRRPVQPLLGMIFGIVSVVLAFFDYLYGMLRIAFGDVWTAVIVLSVFCVIAACIALVFSIIGMRRSIRTGGRKYVAGIVFSGVGIGTSAVAFIFVMITFILENLMEFFVR